MIELGHLEKLEDYELEGRRVLAGRLGYRITARFVRMFFGRIFDNPGQVFSEELLKPELQDPQVFADGVDNIVQAQRRAAQLYFEDGSIGDACPPIQALLHVMAHGQWQGKDEKHPELRAMFTREALLASDWYRERLRVKQARDEALWRRHVAYLDRFVARKAYDEEVARLGIATRLEHARRMLVRVGDRAYLEELAGTIGADPIHRGATSGVLLRAVPAASAAGH
jgi:hypothetical protein